MGKVIMSGIVPNLEEPVVFNGDPVFANNSWETIIETCQNNTVPASWTIGDSKAMTINGKSYQIDVIGKNHDTYTAGGTAPLTFQMHDLYATDYQMNSNATNSGGWEACDMRNKHLPAILALMPASVQAGIKEVNKLTLAGGYSGTIKTTDDKLFLLAEIEIFGSVTYSAAGEGTQYAYYSAGNSRIKKKSGGSAWYWFERSPQSGSSDRYCGVKNDGTAFYYTPGSNMGVAFAFCF